MRLSVMEQPYSLESLPTPSGSHWPATFGVPAWQAFQGTSLNVIHPFLLKIKRYNKNNPSKTIFGYFSRYRMNWIMATPCLFHLSGGTFFGGVRLALC